MTTIATKPYDLQLHVCIGIVSFISEHMQTRSTLVKNGDGCQQLAWNWSQDFVCIFSLLLPQWCLVTGKEMVTGPLQHAAVVFAAISKISDSYNSEQLGTTVEKEIVTGPYYISCCCLCCYHRCFVAANNEWLGNHHWEGNVHTRPSLTIQVT